MTRGRATAPPRLARAIVRAALPPGRFEVVDGDLAELFTLRTAERGTRYARLRYWHDAVSVLLQSPRAPAARQNTGRHIASILVALRRGVRQCARQPAFSLAAVLTLGLGIGTTTTVVSTVRSLLAHPEAAASDDDVLVVWATNRAAGQARDVVSGPTFLDLQRENSTLTGLAAFHFSDLTLIESDRAGVISSLEVTPEFFAVTGIRPVVGRGFEPADAAGDAQLVVLSHEFWQRRFGGNPLAVGRTLRTAGALHRIVGVLPARFRFFDVPDVVILLRREQLAAQERTHYFYWLVGRLRDGATLADAQQDLDGVMSRIAAAHPSARGWTVTAERLTGVLDEPVRPAARMAVTAAGLVLLVACANVAGLLLTRYVARRRELEIQVSLGARRHELFAGLLAEALWLAAAGGAVGISLAAAGVAAVNQLLPPYMAIAGSAGSVKVPEVAVDGSTLLWAALVSLVAFALCAVMPAWRASRPRGLALVAVARGSTGGLLEQRWHSAIVALEAALATVLVVVALLLVQTVSRLSAVEPGFQGDRVVAMIIGRVDDLDARARARYYTEALRRVAGVPGVTMAALNDYVLLTNEDDYEGVEIEGQPRLASGQWPREEWRRVSADYFRTLAIPIRRGRDFVAHDAADSPSVVIVNEAMARKYWPGRDPLGQRLRLTARAYGWSQIIGIAGDVREVGLDQPAKPMMFVPYHRDPRPVMALFARVDDHSDAMIQAIQDAIWSLDATRPVFDVRRVDRLVADSMAVRRLAERVAVVTGLLALLLTAIGFHVTLSYVVSERRREIGVRVAIGARGRDVAAFVLGRGTAPAMTGLVLGLAGAAGLASVARHQLFGISALDPGTYALGAGLLIGVILVACAAPAVRAARIDPAAVLKGE